MSNTKWKDHLLKSSLPFEHIVAEALAKQKWYVDGQYSYARKNENGLHTEFSVDLHAYSEFSSDTHWLATLDLLIECKYSSPGVKWIFLPYPETSTVFGGGIKVFEQASNKRLSTHRYIGKLDASTPYCIRGISLFDTGTDENSVSRGISQLRYAMPRLAERIFRYHADERSDGDIALTFACPILVTSAPIYVLKEKLTLDSLFSATTIEDVASEHEAVMIWDSGSPERENYADDIFKELVVDSGLEKRLFAYREVFPPRTPKRFITPPSIYEVKQAIRESSDHVLVLNHKFLETYLKKVRALVKQSLKSIEKFAEVSFDRETGEVVVKAINPESK